MWFQSYSNLAAFSWILNSQIYVTATQQHRNTLDGYAFDCGGDLVGFQGMNQIFCLTDRTKVMCGIYEYDEATHFLTGQSSSMGRFLAFDLEVHNGILVSFRSDLGQSCHAVSLDWRSYSKSFYMGFTCAEQVQFRSPKESQDHNNYFLVSYETNHFSLGTSGDVALRSPLLFTSGRRLIRDSYGVYTFDPTTEAIHLYFGAHNSQQGMTVILNGRLTSKGDLHLPEHMSSGLPCVHDGTSMIHNVTALMAMESQEVVKTKTIHSQNFKHIKNPAISEDSAWILLSISVLGLVLGIVARRHQH